MRLHRLKFPIHILLLSMGVLHLAESQRRSTSQRPQINQLRPQTSITPANTRIIPPPASKPNQRFRPVTSNRRNSPTLAPASVKMPHDPNDVVICKKMHEISANPKNPAFYRICIPIGRIWVVYTYQCPKGSEFNSNTSKCVYKPKTTTPPTSSIAESTNSSTPEVVTESLILDETTAQSTEEIFTKIPNKITSATPQSKLISTPNFSSSSRGKLTTWGTVGPTSGLPATSATRDPLIDDKDNDNLIWESTVTPKPITRWRLTSTTSSPYKGRFPARASPAPTN